MLFTLRLRPGGDGNHLLGQVGWGGDGNHLPEAEAWWAGEVTVNISSFLVLSNTLQLLGMSPI